MILKNISVKRVFFLGLCLLLAACGPPKFKQDIVLRETDEHGLAIFVGKPDDFSPNIVFSKVDPITKEIGKYFNACLNCFAPTDIYVVGKGEEQATIVKLLPGHYIVRGYFTRKMEWWGAAGPLTHHKFCLGAPLFEIKAGKGHLIPLKGFKNKLSNENAVRESMRLNHNISVPIEKIKFKGTLKFEC